MGRRRKAWADGRTARWYEYQGGKRYHRTKTFGSAKVCREWVRQYNARMDLRLIGEVAAIPFSEAISEFLLSCHGLAKDTLVHHETTLGLFAAVVNPDRVVCDITDDDVRAFVRSREGSSKATIHRHRGSLRRFFHWAMDQGYAAHNPADAIRPAKRGELKRQRPSVSEDQLERLVRLVDREDRFFAVLVALTTGMDRKTVEQLTPQQVDVEAGCFRIRRRKTGKWLYPPIHPQLRTWLARRCARIQPYDRIFAGLSRQWGGEDWWHRVRTEAGLPALLFRDLRAVASSRLQRLVGMPLNDVRELLGHSSVETTAGHYTMPDADVLARFARLPLPALPRIEELTKE